jgi:hypothetical protein
VKKPQRRLNGWTESVASGDLVRLHLELESFSMREWRDTHERIAGRSSANEPVELLTTIASVRMSAWMASPCGDDDLGSGYGEN